MQSIQSKVSLLESQLQLGDLLTTNKQLAKQKRQVHRQRLRLYSQKAVKIKTILKQTNDHSERKCLQNKLQVLKLKQDAEITKLAKIQQIQKEIDQYIDEDVGPIIPENRIQSKSTYNSRVKKHSYQENLMECQNTPGEKFKNNDTICRAIYSSENSENKQYTSDKKKAFSKKKYETQEWNYNDEKREKALRQLTINQLVLSREQSFQPKNATNHNKYKENRYNEVDVKYKNIEKKNKNHHENGNVLENSVNSWKEQQDFERIKSKTNGFSKYLSQQKLKQQDMQIKKRIANQQQTLKELKKRQERQSKKIKESSRKIEELIDEQRTLMERIDKLQKEEGSITKRINGFLASITKSKEIISETSVSINIPQDSIKEQKRHHRFSVDSFESFTSNSNNGSSLTQELHSFQQILQQYLLAVERQSMLAGGELQQTGLKLNRCKQEWQTMQAKKKSLQNELSRLEQYIAKKQRQSNDIHQQFSKIYNDFEQFDSMNKLKHDLSHELEDKCQKLKNKKKTMSDKLKKVEEQLQDQQNLLIQKYTNTKELTVNVDRLNEEYIALKNAIIFSERELQKRNKDLKQLEKIEKNMQVKINQSQQSHEEVVLKIKENQTLLSSLFLQVSEKYDLQNSLSDRARKLQAQLAQSVAVLDEQNSMTLKLTEQIKRKSSELLQIQQKIAESSNNLQGLQHEKVQIEESIGTLKKESKTLQQNIEELKKVNCQLQQILREVMMRKQQLMEEVEMKSKQLESILQDMQSAQQDIKELKQFSNNLDAEIEEKSELITTLTQRSKQLQEGIQENIEQEQNILGRISKIKELEKVKLIQIGLKGGLSHDAQGIRDRVKQTIAQLASLNQIKTQLKDCKYENRRLRLDNQRLQKLIQDYQTKSNI